ncbi:polyphenol oxidase, chloroplastic-like [Carica papaya]|uniref:polyphenol oxidase, chloroplastic-like n=1 Tax=Carica papaya TaxID=3649 RepID=UPI000B8D1082|nr:polyphenol oxidase, chloroplastic-like [Carica papaya]
MASQLSSSPFVTTLFPQKPPQPCMPIRKGSNPKFFPKLGVNVSCNITNSQEDDDFKNPKTKKGELQSSTNKLMFDRRDVLISLGGLYGATTLNSKDPFALAAPIQPPDLSGPFPPKPDVVPYNCLPPTSEKVIDFKPSDLCERLRVRPAAHLVDNEYIAKYEKATELMKALPADDPRSFMQQAKVHCAYCSGGYTQVGFPNVELQVHYSWLFFPFHRYYLYFYEKILGKLIGDPTFALPFWNWDTPLGMSMPTIYTNLKSPLYDPLRDAKHQPPTLTELDYSGVDPTISEKELIKDNLVIMHRQMISGAKIPRLFFGKPIRAGDKPNDAKEGGTIELTPHNNVHSWTGDRNQRNGENMGAFFSAGRDPIFYAHHSNIDRMWEIWKTLGGKRKDLTDTDFLKAGFVFYDENSNLVRVKVKDCLETKNLGYVYQDVDLPWREFKPEPKKSLVKVSVGTSPLNLIQKISMRNLPLNLEKETVKVEVPRPKKSRSKEEKEEEEEVIVIEDIEFNMNEFVKFDVLVNDVEHDLKCRPRHTEFAGSFVRLPHIHGRGKMMSKGSLRLACTDLLEELGAEDDDNVVVSLVPRSGHDIRIGGIKIEFLKE